MAYIFWTLVVLFLGLLIHSTIKRRQFEKGLSEETRNSRKLLEGTSIFVYTDKVNNNTIVRYNTFYKNFILEDFETQETLQIGQSHILLDHDRRILYACFEEEISPDPPQKIPFDAIVDIQILQHGKNKTRTSGGISPISIAGYRVVSFTQRRLHEVKGIILQITYNATDGQENCHVIIFRGSIETGKRKYERIIDNALEIKTYLERL